MHFRCKLDYSRFSQSSANQSNLVQLVAGMQEIKLNNCEKTGTMEMGAHSGKIVKEGTHKELTAKKGAYYTLVKNQLEQGT
jgi:ABC-type bacteriocin/lantibiotic exporter with double-glycine peptidase domain